MAIAIASIAIVLLAYSLASFCHFERRDAEARSFLFFWVFWRLRERVKRLRVFEGANGSLCLSLSPLKEGRTGKDEYLNSSPKLGEVPVGGRGLQ